MPDRDHDAGLNETRRFRRLGAGPETRLEAYRDPAGTGPDIAVAITDLSAAGARLVLSERLPPGHALRLALHAPYGPPYEGVAVVTWSEPAEAGGWATGVVFQRPVGRGDLAALTR